MSKKKNIMKTLRTFSNQIDFEVWKHRNCYQCKKYKTESIRIEEAGCPMAFDMDLASVSDGTMPMECALMIGIDGHGLRSECAKIEKTNG